MKLYIYIKLQLLSFILLFFVSFSNSSAQDTFSIVAIDSLTGEVGSAGASCVDLFNIPGYTNDFLGDLIPGTGAINTQAAYLAQNQVNARNRLLAGDTPQQIITWLDSNDVQNNPGVRQYGIAAFVNGSPETAGYTGINCMNYKNHITGPNYSIQGNILLGQQILDSMESRFLNEPGDLACKLMAALQGAKVPGADTRCMTDGTSSLFAFVKVSQPTDPYGSPSFLVSVKTHDNAGIEPIDTLQTLFDLAHSCSPIGLNETPMKDVIIARDDSEHTLTVSFPSLHGELWRCQIFNLRGKLVFDNNISSGTLIHMQEWRQGIYILQLDDGSHVMMEKFVKP